MTPAEEARAVQHTDFIVLRLAVSGLILALLGAIVGVVVLTYANKDIPEGVIAIASAAVGALATMLVRAPNSGSS